MRVAYFCHRIPYPPDKGDKIRAFHQIRALSASHEVDLFTLVDDPADLQHRASLKTYCGRVHTALIDPGKQKLRSLPYVFTRTALTLPYFHSAELAEQVRTAFRSTAYDVIFVYCSAMFQYVEDRGPIPVVTDLVDVDSDKWKQYGEHARFPLSTVYRREARYLEQYERTVCKKSESVIVTTEREAALVRTICPGSDVHVIGNGVDTSYFCRSGESSAHRQPSVLFTGDMSYFPNQEAVRFFAREVLPAIQQSVPDTRFLIVGRNPSAQVLELRSVKGVEVTGYVPDVRTYLAQSQVSVAPFSIAAGIQNKVLEAMAYGLPVVATSKAVQGLTSDAASLVETANEASDFAEKVVALLRDPQLAARIGAEGRRCIALHYDWDACLARVLSLVERAVPVVR